MNRLCAILLTTGLLLSGGCGNYTRPVVKPAQLTPEERNFERVWKASQDVLRKYDFQIDRQDRRAGIITTELMTGKHWFEFWRRDAATAYDVAESTVQTIYRAVQVKITKAEDQPATYVPEVKVYSFRSDAELVQVTSTSQAISLFHLGGHTPPPGPLLLDQKAPSLEADDQREGASTRPASGVPSWLVPVGKDGRDPNLEAKILADIRKTAARSGRKGN